VNAISDDYAGKSSKKKKQPTAKSKAKPKPPPAPAPSINAYRPVVSAEQEQDLMASILGNMDNIVPDALPTKASRKRKPSPTYDSDTEPAPKRSDYSSYRRKPTYDASSDGVPDDSHQQPSSDDGYSYSSPNKRVRVDDADTALTPTTEGLAHLDVQSGSDDFDYDAGFDDIDIDALMQVDEEDFKPTKPPVKSEPVEVSIPKKSSVKKPVEVKTKKEEPDVKPAWFSVYDSLVVDTESSLGPLNSSSSTSSSNPSNASILEDDGSLRFFWLDYLELDGKLYFTGKLKDKSSGTWLSCCVTVEGIERNLFVLPREKRIEMDEEGTMHETDIVPSQDDIDDDFDLIRKSCNIKGYRGKFVKRKYAFGETDIPRGEGLWMKVVYGFNGELLASPSL
jgi:DNA polymerase alpha subunit A